jgi:uncharacterized delta-60 repeat protein
MRGREGRCVGRPPRRRAGRGVGCEALEARWLFAAGDTDPSFVGGSAQGPLLQPYRTADVVVQADGKTLVCGTIGNDAEGFVVARYNLNGSKDTAFGPDHDGTVRTPFPPDSHARAMALQNDGKIVVVGTADDDTETRVVRYNPDGGLDRTFDGDGVVGIGGLVGVFSRLLIQTDGKILLGGNRDGGPYDPHSDLAFARLNPDGSPDLNFGVLGSRVVDFDADEEIAAMAFDYSGTAATNPDYGKVVVAATQYNADRTIASILVARLTTSGTLDTFGYDGRRGGFSDRDLPMTEACGLVVQDDGRVVVGGTVGGVSGSNLRDFLAVRFTHDGSRDSSFGGAGNASARADFGFRDRAADLLQLPSGALALAGSAASSERDSDGRAAIAYFTPDGLPDTRFGATAQRTYLLGTGVVQLARGPGRRFVAAGGSSLSATRVFDVGANLVYALALNPNTSEGKGPNGEDTAPVSRGFAVIRSERLPVPTRVYFDVTGTATAPGGTRAGGSPDYTADGMTFPIQFPGLPPGVPYVDIPANEVLANVIVTPREDALVEGNETADFTIRDNAAYEVGDPRTAHFVIADDDAPPPSVSEVYARGSAWRGDDYDPQNVTFKEYLASRGMGHAEYGYRLGAGAALPWTNVNQLVLRYSSPPADAGKPTAGVTVAGSDPDAGYAVASVAEIDPRTFVLTLDRPLATTAAGAAKGDRVRLAVAGNAAVQSYELRFNALPGDVNGSGLVDAFDYSEVKKRFFKDANAAPTGANDYGPLYDVDGSGSILAEDYSQVKKRFFAALPGVTALAAAPPATAPLRTAPVSRELLAAPAVL